MGYKSEVSLATSLGLINLLEQLTGNSLLMHTSSSKRGTIKSMDEQPVKSNAQGKVCWKGANLPCPLQGFNQSRSSLKPIPLGFLWRLSHIGKVNHKFHFQPFSFLKRLRVGWEFQDSNHDLCFSGDQPPSGSPAGAHLASPH